MTTRTIEELLSAEFEASEVMHFQGRGGQTFEYIEDETVMDRLDMVLGVGNWSIEVEPISVADGIVKVRLSGLTPDGKAFRHEDFGYQTRDGGEALKEAVSDGIRRCGRYLGIGRYLYRKHDSSASGGRGPSSPRPSAPPRPVAVADVPDEPADLFPPIGGSAPASIPTDECPIHGEQWRGTPGDLYHGPKGIVEGGYCRHPDNVKKARRAG